MKRIVLILISTALAYQRLAHALIEAPDVIAQEPQTYNKDTKIGFELINDSPEPIWIAVQNGGSLLEQKGNNALKILSPKSATTEQLRSTKAGLPLPPIGTVKRVELDTNKDTLLMLWTEDPGTVKIKDISHPGHISLKKPAAMFTFPKGKTLYLRYMLIPRLETSADPLKKMILPYEKKLAGALLPQIVQRGGGPVRTITKLVATNNVTESDIKGIPIPE